MNRLAMSTEVHFDEHAACDRCGRFGAFLFDDTKLCADCYESRGTCSPEPGAEDMPARPDLTVKRVANPELL